MTRVALDAMGGDHAPDAILDGVVLAVERGILAPEDVLLAGPQADLRERVEAKGLPAGRIEIHDAPDVLDGHESPVDALRKKARNSIAVAMQLVKAGQADAFLSAGNTGIVVATASLALRRLEGIRRAGIAVTIEGGSGPFIICDVGANPQPKAVHLLQYGLMGAAYYHDAFGAEEPRVALMNIGSEDGKGNPLVKQASRLLRDSALNFVGNIEGVGMFSGECDVIVCDGFSGNILLKASEGVAEYMLRTIVALMDEAEVSEQKRNQILGKLHRKVDYSEYGGALLLGVEGIVTICHGRSRGPAICNAIRFATKAVGANLNQHIVHAARSVTARS